MGKMWCVEKMGLTEAQIRQKASRLGLKASGVSKAWHEKQKQHAEILRGRKRPDQSIVMKRLHAEGKLAQNSEQRAASRKGLKEWHKKNEHPRGMLGKSHSEATKELLRKTSTNAAFNRTDEQEHERILKMMKTKQKNGTIIPPRNKASWKAAWREIGGIRKFYRSRWEANFARYLEFLKSTGEIAKWEHEPETFWFEGVKRGTVSYLPDFRVEENDGAIKYYEIKGWMDSRSKTKLKRMKKYHPEVDLVLIDSKAYKELEKQMKQTIPEWE